jgi:hypothetical protein
MPISTGITASSAMLNLVNIIALNVIFGCQQQKIPTIATTAEYAVLGAETTFNIAITVECVSTWKSYMIMIVRLGSTYPTAPYAKMTYSKAGHGGMKCLVDIQYIRIASATYLPTISVVPSVRNLPTFLND